MTVGQAIGVLAATILTLDPAEWQDAWMALGMFLDKLSSGATSAPAPLLEPMGDLLEHRAGYQSERK